MAWVRVLRLATRGKVEGGVATGVNKWDRVCWFGERERASIGPCIKYGPCCASPRAWSAVQARPAPPYRASLGPLAIGPCHAWIGPKWHTLCRAIVPRPTFTHILFSHCCYRQAQALNRASYLSDGPLGPNNAFVGFWTHLVLCVKQGWLAWASSQTARHSSPAQIPYEQYFVWAFTCTSLVISCQTPKGHHIKEKVYFSSSNFYKSLFFLLTLKLNKPPSLTF